MHDVHVQRSQDSNERRDWQLLLQVIYSTIVNKCEAMFPTERLKISKCAGIKCLLETNFASSVKPTNISSLCLALYLWYILTAVDTAEYWPVCTVLFAIKIESLLVVDMLGSKIEWEGDGNNETFCCSIELVTSNINAKPVNAAYTKTKTCKWLI